MAGQTVYSFFSLDDTEQQNLLQDGADSARVQKMVLRKNVLLQRNATQTELLNQSRVQQQEEFWQSLELIEEIAFNSLAPQLYHRAATGFGSSQYKLGCLYYVGYKVPKILPFAVKWIRRASNQGYAAAQYALGTMYLDGIGVEQNQMKALDLFRKAGERGHLPADSLYNEIEFGAEDDTVASDLVNLIHNRNQTELFGYFEDLISYENDDYIVLRNNHDEKYEVFRLAVEPADNLQNFFANFSESEFHPAFWNEWFNPAVYYLPVNRKERSSVLHIMKEKRSRGRGFSI